MVARAWGLDTKKWDRPSHSASLLPRIEGASKVEEMFVQNDTVSLCLLLNRRTKTMRVIDFRAGPSHAKRIFVLKLAKREGIEKVYTLVERDEVSTWIKLGFTKEANISGFYKRSDAFLLGSPVDGATFDFDPMALDVDEDEDHDVLPTASTASHDFAEKTLVQAKKRTKELLDRPLPPTKVALVKEVDIKK